MKFFTAMIAATAATKFDTLSLDEGSMVQLDSKAQLLSAAMSLTNTRAEAHSLLKEALHSFEGVHSFELMTTLDAQSSAVSVPIDEKKEMTLKVQPTLAQDTVNSVTLKAFRKMVGYDTFESIRKGERGEAKDSKDYYNVTVSMVISRAPQAAAAAATGGLAQSLDRGFPYDE